MLNIEKSNDLIDKICEITGITDWQIVSFCDDFDRKPRYYHNSDHILEMCENVFKLGINKDSTRKLIWTAFFHDAIYDPKSKTNEEDSANLFARYVNDSLHYGLCNSEVREVYDIIIDTKTHEPRTELSRILCELDLIGFIKPFYKILENEMKIRKEYEWVEWDDYKKGKLDFLTSYSNKKIVNNHIYIKRGMVDLFEYIRNEKAPNIGIMAGSFSPMHIGHKNILQKAEKIFDKVIIAFGTNPEKPKSERVVPEFLKYKQVDFYEGSLIEYLNTKTYNPTIIKGLRNATDLQYELNQYRWLQDYKKDLKLISLFCDRQYEHISSSSIRALETYPDLAKTSQRFKL